MEDPKNEQVKSKRESFLERLKGKYPDKQFADDEEIYGAINDDYDNYDNELKRTSLSCWLSVFFINRQPPKAMSSQNSCRCSARRLPMPTKTLRRWRKSPKQGRSILTA